MKNLLLILLLFGGINQIFAQNSKELKEEIQAKKVAFISNELGLTTDEAKEFWPVYNQYEADMKSLHQKNRSIVNKFRNFDELSDEEAYQATQDLINLDSEKAKIKSDYLVKFSKILGKKKGAKVFYAEEKFKKVLLKNIRNGGPPPPPGE